MDDYDADNYVAVAVAVAVINTIEFVTHVRDYKPDTKHSLFIENSLTWM
jgi:hypothetical protein